jgi:hypothetical protein
MIEAGLTAKDIVATALACFDAGQLRKAGAQ